MASDAAGTTRSGPLSTDRARPPTSRGLSTQRSSRGHSTDRPAAAASWRYSQNPQLGAPYSRGDVSWRNTAQLSARSFLRTEGSTVSKRCKVSGDGLHFAMARKPQAFTIHAFNAAGEPVKRGGDPFVVAVRGASTVRPKVIDNEDGSYAPSHAFHF